MFISRLMNNPYAWTILAFCTVAAFIFAIYTWIAGKKRKELTCISNSYNVIRQGKSLTPELQMIYKGRSIEDFTVTNYAIWNSGNEVINCADIVEERPLRILSNSCETAILDVQIVTESDETNKFLINSVTDSVASIYFNYADPKDGVVVQVMHTGSDSKLSIDCKMKGGKKLRNLNGRGSQKRLSKKRARNILTILMGIETLMITILGIMLFLVEWNVIDEEILYQLQQLSAPNVVKKALAVIESLFVISLIYIFFGRVKRQYYFDIPSTLRKNIELDKFE